MKVKFKALFCSSLLILSSSLLHAQQDTVQPKPIFNWDYIHSGFLDARDQLIAPLHWNGVEWMSIAAIASAESVLIYGGEDKNIQQLVQNNRSPFTNTVENLIGDPYGSGAYASIVIGTMYITGSIFHVDKPRQFAMLATKSLILSGITTEVVKCIVERHRPYQDNSPNPENWDGPMGNFAHVSFPSGHTTVAFSLATMIALEYPKPIIIPILAYSFATITALGRLNGNFHWASDVLMGASIGYFTSMLVFQHNNWGKVQHKKKILVQ
jgi:membrane-associated phospholipid phosphatase